MCLQRRSTYLHSLICAILLTLSYSKGGRKKKSHKEEEGESKGKGREELLRKRGKEFLKRVSC